MTHKVHIDLQIPKVVLVSRPWWKFWGRDRLASVNDWKRITLGGLSDAQRELMETQDAQQAELLRTLIERPGEKLLSISFDN